MSSTPPVMLTVRGVTERFGWGRTTTYKLIGEGRLEVRKIGRRTLISNASCERLVNGDGIQTYKKNHSPECG